jgi:hypothetical protein
MPKVTKGSRLPVNPYVRGAMQFVRTAAPLYRAVSSSMTQTERRRGMQVRGGMNASLAGKRYRGRSLYVKRTVRRRGRRYTRRYLRQPYRKQYGSALAGYSTVAQDGTTVSDPNCVYVAGKTFNAGQVRQTVIYALVKAVLEKAGIDISHELDFVDGISADTRFIINYRANEALGSQETIVTPPVSPNNTFVGVAAAVLGGMVTASSVLVCFEALTYIPDITKPTRFQLNIQNLKVKMYCKTSLKMQNRSLNAAVSGETQSDDLDRCPVSGKVYRGVGCGPTIRNTAVQLPVYTSASNVSAVYAAGPSQWRSAPDAIEFRNCSSSNSIRLNPGAIKTEVITHTMFIGYNELLRHLFMTLTAAGGGGTYFSPWGKYVMCAFEKVIGNVTGNSQNVQIILEAEEKIYVKLYNRDQKYMKRALFSVV